MKSITFKGLAEASSVGVETVCYYQLRGLLEAPERSGGGIRRYSDHDIKRLRFIRSAWAAGFTLEEISERLVLDATNNRKRALQAATKRLAKLDIKISELQKARIALKHLANEWGSSSLGLAQLSASLFTRPPSDRPSSY